MHIRRITDSFSVSPQIDPGDVSAIKAAGFKSILCNRPDGEEAGQCDHDAIRAATEAAGLVFANVPVDSGGITHADLDEFDAAIARLPAPVLAYCRSGTRCTMLWSINQVGQMPVDDIVAAAADAGYDVRSVVTQMSGARGAQ